MFALSPCPTCPPSLPTTRTSLCVVRAVTALALSLLTIGTGALLLDLPLALPLLITGLVLLSLSLILLVLLKTKRPTLPTLPPTPPHTPPPPPKVPSAPVVVVPPPVVIPTPPLSKCTEAFVSQTLKEHFQLSSIAPTRHINVHTHYVLLSSKHSPLQLCLLRGHPVNDPCLKQGKAAVLIFTNSLRDFSYAIGRCLSWIARIEKKCWQRITGDPDSSPFPPGSIAHGAWTDSSNIPTPAQHLIFLNPPTLELQVDLGRKHRAITFADFNYKTAMQEMVKAYQRCFAICREENLECLQLEIIGLTDLGSHQEEYIKWEQICSLALLQAITSEERHPNTTLKYITINGLKILPMFQPVKQAFSS